MQGDWLDGKEFIYQKGVASHSSRVRSWAFLLIFSLFPIPVGVENILETLQGDFFWDNMGDEFKFHLVKWNTCCTPAHLGVSGIKKVVLFNQALLGNWLCRYECEEKALWRQV